MLLVLILPTFRCSSAETEKPLSMALQVVPGSFRRPRSVPRPTHGNLLIVWESKEAQVQTFVSSLLYHNLNVSERKKYEIHREMSPLIIDFLDKAVYSVVPM